MADTKKHFTVGQRVKFLGTHDRSHQLTGTIEKFHDDSDLVDITAEPDGHAVEVESVITANIADLEEVED
jgi:hypothetical protein